MSPPSFLRVYSSSILSSSWQHTIPLALHSVKNTSHICCPSCTS
jgi:hypothetical protein